MNRMTCGLIRLYLTQDIKYHVLYEMFAMKMRGILEKKYLMKSIESQLLLKRRLYRFQLKKGSSSAEPMDNYTKFLTDLINVDVDIKEEDNTKFF